MCFFPGEGTSLDSDEDSSSHFMSYFLVFMVLCIAGYIIFHNKQKVIMTWIYATFISQYICEKAFYTQQLSIVSSKRAGRKKNNKKSLWNDFMI